VVCLPNFHTKSALRCSACFSPSAHPNPILAHPIPSAHTPTRPPLPSHLIALPARVSTHCVRHKRLLLTYEVSRWVAYPICGHTKAEPQLSLRACLRESV
jgi:hypothetical protein